MLGAGLLTEAAQIRDAADPVLRHRSREVPRGVGLTLGEAGVAAAAHRVHEVVGDVDPVAGADETRAVEDVALVQLAPGVLEISRPRTISHQTADVEALFAEATREPAADEPRGTGDEGAHHASSSCAA